MKVRIEGSSRFDELTKERIVKLFELYEKDYNNVTIQAASYSLYEDESPIDHYIDFYGVPK